MPMTAANRNEELRVFYNALADRTLEPGDPAYVQNVHQESTGDPIEDLVAQVLWNQGGGTYLFTGQRGTGKSTELRRLRRDLEREGCEVFLLDMANYLHETEPVEIGDFLISLMGALSDEVARKHDQAWLPQQESYWERISAFLLKTDVTVKELDLKTIKFGLKEDRTFKQKIQKAAANHVAPLVSDARAFASALVKRLEQELGADKRLVVIADSVERLRGVNAESAKKVFDSVVALFSGNPDRLRYSPLHIVYSVPPYLSALTANLSALYSSRLVSLASVRVFKTPSALASRQPDDDRDGRLAVMESLVSARYADWGSVLTPAQLKRLAIASGGDIRDYFRLLRDLLVKARNPAQSLPVPDLVLDSVENAMRREMLPIPANHQDWLKRIAASHTDELDDLSGLATFAGFLDSRVVLNYRNGKDWYDVHPLLWDLIDQHEPRRPAAG